MKTASAWYEKSGGFRKPSFLPVGYIIVEGGGEVRTLHWMAGVRGIPGEKPDLGEAMVRVALALGFRAVYVDAGSGASSLPSREFLRAVAAYRKRLPVIYGGGIRTVEDFRFVIECGIRNIVIGTAAFNGSLTPEEVKGVLEER